MKRNKWVSLIIGFILLASCTGVKNVEVGSAKGFKHFDSKVENNDFVGNCRISIRSADLNQGGRCTIILTKDGQFKLTILHPFGGTLLQSYMTRDIVQLKDSVNETFFQGKNTAQSRGKILGSFNFNINEIRQIFFGRKTSQAQPIYFSPNDKVPVSAAVRSIRITYKSWGEYEGVIFPKSILIEDVIQGNRLKIAFTTIKSSPSTGKEYPLIKGHRIQF